MKIVPTKIPDVLILEPSIFSDHRGRFAETHRTKDLAEAARGKFNLVQGNISYSMPWTIRGLHYQNPHPQGKLVRVAQGKIQDVAVDLRADSPTYGQHVSVMLDDKECKAIWVPPGFAHGFLAFEFGATVTYECSTYYSDEWAGAVKWNDPDLGILWGLPMGRDPIISNKDRAAPAFKDVSPIVL